MFVVKFADGSFLGNGRYGPTSFDLQKARTFSARSPASNAAASASYYMEANTDADGNFIEPPSYSLVEVHLNEGPLP